MKRNKKPSLGKPDGPVCFSLFQCAQVPVLYLAAAAKAQLNLGHKNT